MCLEDVSGTDVFPLGCMQSLFSLFVITFEVAGPCFHAASCISYTSPNVV